MRKLKNREVCTASKWQLQDSNWWSGCKAMPLTTVQESLVIAGQPPTHVAECGPWRTYCKNVRDARISKARNDPRHRKGGIPEGSKAGKR